MAWIAFLIYIEEVEKVAEKSNLFTTILYFNYLRRILILLLSKFYC